MERNRAAGVGFKELSKLKVWNRTRGVLLAGSADIADTSAKRRTGLLKHSALADGEGLWIAPCEAVHTIGMKFPIDVLFLSRKRKVLKIRPDMHRWKMALCLRGHSVLELPSGTCQRTGTMPGDVLELEKFDV